MSQPPRSVSSAQSAAWVGLGIFLSRVAGLVRERVFAHYFGNLVAADAFRAAVRIPNLLQNLLGEGVLSASFIPVYARLRAEGRDQTASQVASAVAALLALLVSVLVALGVMAAPWLVALLAPGFEGQKREATVLLVRILFPGIGLLVLSAWCLGVQNSHRRFFLSYAAPILWNLAQIGVLLIGGARVRGYPLAEWLAWGAVLGSLLQLAVQLPVVLRLLGAFRPAFGLVREHVREVTHNLGPVVLGRGVVQLSAYVDSVLASWLPSGAVAALGYAQILYMLPISLFGMAVSAAELPEMSSLIGSTEDIHRALRHRLARGLARIAFFVVPSSVAFLLLGDVLSALLFQTGRFSHDDAVYVWTILGGSAVGLLAVTFGRLYASVYYALRDTRTPLRFALVRLVLTATLGWVAALELPGWLGIRPAWGAAGLTASAGVAGWIEFVLLRRSLHARLGKVALAASLLGKLWLAAGLGAMAAWAVRWGLPAGQIDHPVWSGLVILSLYGLVYLAAAWLLGVATARELGAALGRRVKWGEGRPR
ncbi:MAG: murein biosynthesis integral membrane protein MurJ [Polyangiaceae bacterium]|nr:murein biosynthesis integral membrane protein MurJ [Polyangiaceae bacterium]